jgi:hypothetical protein
MATTFFADCAVFDGYNEDTAKYAEKHWRVRLRAYSEEDMKTPGLNITNVLAITVRDYPEIMPEVERSGYFRNEPPVWQVNRISEQGITFYLVNRGGKSEDGRHDLWEEVFIFIPMSNVIAIHNVSQQFFINESLRAMERKEKSASES